jgi:uncharacterized protein (DUF1501 family)
MKSRREFLRQLAFGSTSAIDQAGAQPLICIFLRGGADTLNMIVPWADDDYYKARPSIGIAPPGKGINAAAALDDFYALHPRMMPLAPAYHEGRMAIVQAVGSDNSSGSHFDAQDQMEHGECAGCKLQGGWLGRHMRSRVSKNSSALSAVAIGVTIPESLRGAPAVSALTSVEEVQISLPQKEQAIAAAALESLYASQVDVVGAAGQDTLQLLKRIAQLKQEPSRSNPVSYPDTVFAHGLKEIARLVKADLGLEVACIDSDGWDTHFMQGTTDGLQADRIKELSEAVAALDRDLVSAGKKAVIVIMTEFGRRIYENASLGTDHGRGFAMIVIGSGVRGGKVYGKWPGLADTGAFTFGPAGLAINIDYRAVLAEVLSPLSDESKLATVFPNLRRLHLGLLQSDRAPHIARL